MVLILYVLYLGTHGSSRMYRPSHGRSCSSVPRPYLSCSLTSHRCTSLTPIPPPDFHPKSTFGSCMCIRAGVLSRT